MLNLEGTCEVPIFPVSESLNQSIFLDRLSIHPSDGHMDHFSLTLPLGVGPSHYPQLDLVYII